MFKLTKKEVNFFKKETFFFLKKKKKTFVSFLSSLEINEKTFFKKKNFFFLEILIFWKYLFISYIRITNSSVKIPTFLFYYFLYLLLWQKTKKEVTFLCKSIKKSVFIKNIKAALVGDMFYLKLRLFSFLSPVKKNFFFIVSKILFKEFLSFLFLLILELVDDIYFYKKNIKEDTSLKEWKFFFKKWYNIITLFLKKWYTSITLFLKKSYVEFTIFLKIFKKSYSFFLLIVLIFVGIKTIIQYEINNIFKLFLKKKTLKLFLKKKTLKFSFKKKIFSFLIFFIFLKILKVSNPEYYVFLYILFHINLRYGSGINLFLVYTYVYYKYIYEYSFFYNLTIFLYMFILYLF